MGKTTYSVVDTVSGVYLGLRAAEPGLMYMKGEWNAGQVQDELVYRFGFFGSDGQFAPVGSIKTYGPVVGMQVGKKIVRWFTGGKSFRIGPFRIP